MFNFQVMKRTQFHLAKSENQVKQQQQLKDAKGHLQQMKVLDLKNLGVNVQQVEEIKQQQLNQLGYGQQQRFQYDQQYRQQCEKKRQEKQEEAKNGKQSKTKRITKKRPIKIPYDIKDPDEHRITPNPSNTSKRIMNPRLAKILINEFTQSSGRSLTKIAEQFGISTKSIYRYRRQYVQTGTITVGVNKRKSLKIMERYNAIKDIAAQVFAKRPVASIVDLKRQLKKREIEVSTATIGKVLKKQNFTYKKMSYVPFSRNTEEVINKRFEYCKQLKQIPDQKLFFTDQTSFNLKTAPGYGWALKGRSPTFKVADNSGQTISVLAVIGVKGLLSFSIIKGTARTENVENYFKKGIVPNMQDKDYVLVMDNVRSHRSLQVINFINTQKMNVKYLPPYTPQLNPIQNLFGVIKSRFRRMRIEQEVRTTNQLIYLIKRVFEEQYQMDLSNYYRKMREYVTLGLKKIPYDRFI